MNQTTNPNESPIKVVEMNAAEEAKVICDNMGLPSQEELKKLLTRTRDALLHLRNSQVYCPYCSHPQWEPGTRVWHYANKDGTPDCELGKLTEEYLAIYPKEGATVKWRR